MPTLTNEDLEMMKVLEQNTGSHAHDVVMNGDKIIFVIKTGELGKAIGKQGANIQKLRDAFKKPVEVVEWSEERDKFIANLFFPVAVTTITEGQTPDGKPMLVLEVDPANKGLAIGKQGEKIKRARLLMQRLYDLADVKIK